MQVLYVLMTVMAMMPDSDCILLTEWYVMQTRYCLQLVAVTRRCMGTSSLQCVGVACASFSTVTKLYLAGLCLDVETLSAFVQKDLCRSS